MMMEEMKPSANVAGFHAFTIFYYFKEVRRKHL
jgi:hypothetical protein